MVTHSRPRIDCSLSFIACFCCSKLCSRSRVALSSSSILTGKNASYTIPSLDRPVCVCVCVCIPKCICTYTIRTFTKAQCYSVHVHVYIYVTIKVRRKYRWDYMYMYIAVWIEMSHQYKILLLQNISTHTLYFSIAPLAFVYMYADLRTSPHLASSSVTAAWCLLIADSKSSPGWVSTLPQ